MIFIPKVWLKLVITLLILIGKLGEINWEKTQKEQVLEVLYTQLFTVAGKGGDVLEAIDVLSKAIQRLESAKESE